MEERRGCSWKGFLLIVLGILACSIVSTLGFDALCYNTLSKRLPVYPGADITFENESLRRYGMGETIMILDTDDPPDEVREWYGQYTGNLNREMQQNGVGGMFFSFSKAAWSVTTAEDGTGSQILLSGACMSG